MRAGGPVTLITAVKDVADSHVPVLVDHLTHVIETYIGVDTGVHCPGGGVRL